MKKIVIVCLICLCSALVGQEELVIGQPHAVILNYLHHEWIIGLDDGSYWKIMPLKNRPKQSWTEWWFDLAPKEWNLEDHFFFDPQTWKDLSEIQIYEIKEELFPGYKHILENIQTGQKVFAKFIPVGSEPIPKLEYAGQFLNHPIKNASKICLRPHFDSQAVILEDETIWLIIPTQLNEQSWKEWWNNEEIQQPDDPFIFPTSSWQKGDRIQIYFYEKNNYNALHDLYLPEQKESIFLLENQTKNQLAYAKNISVAEWTDLCMNYAFSQYQAGYVEGRNIGYSEGYGFGYSQGYSSGYSSGYNNSAQSWKN
jgi:hypothetical protein